MSGKATTPAKLKQKRQRPERKIERAILDYLSWSGWLAIKFNSGVIMNPYNNAPFHAYKIANTNSSAGMCDIFAAKDGKLLFLEVKTDVGRQSKSQKDFERLCSKTGNDYRVVRSLDEVIELIKESE